MWGRTGGTKGSREKRNGKAKDRIVDNEVMNRRRQWDIFCKVIDNYGDLGVAWRLAKDLATRGQAVRLWVDDASALAWMAPGGALGVDLMAWPAPGQSFEQLTSGDVLVEAFGCDIPEAFIAQAWQRHAAGAAPPCWTRMP